MSTTNVRGKDIVLKQPPVNIFSAFSDLRNFSRALPPDMKDKVQVDKDSISGEAGGIRMGVRVDERVPFSLVSLKDDGQSPFPFRISFHMEPMGLDSTLFHIELSAELNMMMKMMLGSKLQELVDKLSEQLEKAVMNGAAPDMNDFKPENFMS